MTVIDLTNGKLSARISTKGGIVLGFWWEGDDGRVPLLREAPDDDATALASGCYPLVPFGNRVRDNRFTFNGRDYSFEPNTDWDRHYLHGEGWQGDWTIEHGEAGLLELSFDQPQSVATPYRYSATQRFVLADSGFELMLSVTNTGRESLPFGLGWHPYFPMTPNTTLQAPARKYWTEVDGWLPGEVIDIPEDVNFSTPRGLPHRWVNNGFEGWSGVAQIVWPEHGAQLSLTADPIFRHAFVFASDTSFDPAFKRDYFCFEPMSHLANGHNMQGLGDLTILAPGETLTGSMRMVPSVWTEQARPWRESKNMSQAATDRYIIVCGKGCRPHSRMSVIEARLPFPFNPICIPQEGATR